MLLQHFANLDFTGRPHEFYEKICSIWRDVIGSSSVWLWIHDTTRNVLEPLGINPTCDELTVQPEPMLWGVAGIVELALASRAPIRVDDVQTFSLSFNGANFRVNTREVQPSTSKMLAIPFWCMRQSVGSFNSPSIQGVLTCHFDSATALSDFANEELSAMAKLTAERIVGAHREEQYRILLELNRLSGAFSSVEDPRKTRIQYLSRVSTVIHESLRATAVSVFYKKQFENAIECVYTDGLSNGVGSPVSQESLSNVQYNYNEGRTGKCFAENVSFSRWNTKIEDSDEKYFETNDSRIVQGPTLFCPIPRTWEFNASKSDGVVRCSGHVGPFDRVTDFDSFEIQTLKFICDQVSPVLKALDVRIQREDQINVIKHDLRVPAMMIQDTIEKLELRNQISDESVYAAHDIRLAARFLTNLISQLDVEPSDIRVFKQPTYLMGDIVARNATMLRYYGRIENDMEIVFSGFESIPRLRVDPNLVERAVFNLVINAIKFGDKGTSVQIRASAHAQQFVVDVSNDGIGIEEFEMLRIFERNYRSPRARQKAMGAGLGLYIAKAAMESQGAGLVLARQKDPTVFRLTFPRHFTCQ